MGLIHGTDFWMVGMTIMSQREKIEGNIVYYDGGKRQKPSQCFTKIEDGNSFTQPSFTRLPQLSFR